MTHTGKTLNQQKECSTILKKSKRFDLSLSEIKELNLEMTIPPPESISCVFCGEKIETRGLLHYCEDRIWLWLEPECTCKEAKAEKERKEREEKEKKEQEERKKKIEKLFSNSKISARFQRRNFDNFSITPDNKIPYETSRKYTLNFQKLCKEGIGIMLIGPYGTGKTHLVTAIAIELIKQEISVITGTLISLLEKIKQSWQNNKFNEWEVLKAYNTADLLIIDDLGKEKPSEWALEKLYSIINERYENMKPILITTNFENRDLIDRLTISSNNSTSKAIVSRLNEMCRVVKCYGQDWRLK